MLTGCANRIARVMAGALVPLAAVCGLSMANAGYAADVAAAPKDGRIGYALSYLFFAMYQSPDPKSDCPHGYNIGPRGQFTALFPPGKPHTVAESQLSQEIKTWHPDGTPDTFSFYEPVGNKAYGLNLDGKVGPNDYMSPEGEAGLTISCFEHSGASSAGVDRTVSSSCLITRRSWNGGSTDF